MLDEFIWGEVKRISPEAPVPVVDVKRETFNLGGAGNVISNLIALGAQAVPIGVIGNDDAGKKIKELFSQISAPVNWLVSALDRPTTRKTRIVAHSRHQSQQMVRADREDKSDIAGATQDDILSSFKNALKDADACIISDYEKGLLTPAVLESVIETANSLKKIITLDPKIKNSKYYRNVYLITPNQLEAEKLSGIEIIDDSSIELAARRIRDSINCRNVLITRGENGMSLLDEHDHITHIPTVARRVYDVTGAGDTVIATLTLALASGSSLIDAAHLANQAAGLVVRKLGTATVSLDELREVISM